jgi:hypothetical protein
LGVSFVRFPVDPSAIDERLHPAAPPPSGTLSGTVPANGEILVGNFPGESGSVRVVDMFVKRPGSTNVQAREIIEELDPGVPPTARPMLLVLLGLGLMFVGAVTSRRRLRVPHMVGETS